MHVAVISILPEITKKYSNFMSQWFPDRYSGLVHLMILFVGIVIMDGGVNAAFTPFEALLDDMYDEQPGGSQRAFGMKSFMVSVGGAFGRFLLRKIRIGDFDAN